jgi:hypothetical protein
MTLAAIWREWRALGIFDLAGRELRFGGTGRARRIGNLIGASLAYELDPDVSLDTHSPQDGSCEAPGGDTILTLYAEAMQRF